MISEGGHSFWSVASALHQNGDGFVVVTLVSSRGHAPQDPGAKIIVTREGLNWGTVGGGKIEARAIAEAKARLSEVNSSGIDPRFVTWNLQRDLGMSCGGEVQLLFEFEHKPVWEIVVFGAGHVAQALVRVLIPLKASITCIDSRHEWLAKMPKAPNLRTLLYSDEDSELDQVIQSQVSSASFVAVMTMGHSTDLPILKRILMRQGPVAYLGLIGSPVKATKMKSDLERSGIPLAHIEHLRCPIGLSLGNQEPHEIAISIAAQMIQCRDVRRKT